MKIALAQLNLTVGDLNGNAQQIIQAAQYARDRLKAQVLLCPELSLCAYPPEDLLLRPSFLADCEAVLKKLTASIQNIEVILGYPKRRGDRLYNTAGLIRNGQIVAEYDKQSLPNYSVFDEKRYFSPGQQSCRIEIAGIPASLSICEDIWQWQQPIVAEGSRLLLNLNASPFHQGKQTERENIARQRAQRDGVAVVYTNLVGGQDELVFDGGSFAISAQGQLGYRAPSFKECIETVEFNSAGHLIPATIQPELMAEESIYQALVMGVRDYVLKSGFSGVVLGLSGGIDSALTLAIAVDALGADQVEAVLMPSRYTAEISNKAAVQQAETLGVKYQIIPIEPAFQAFLDMLKPSFAGLPMDVTEENIQARCRGIILMAISNKSGKMLLTTGNKSELSVGYATLYGDMAGGFAPLKDVFKTMVYRLALWRNRHHEIIPQVVIERPPSAELRPNQKDSDSLPPYDILDAILMAYVEQDQHSSDLIAAGYDPDTVHRIIRLVIQNEYKRRQAPPGVKISRRAYGRDRRYPIVNRYTTKE